ncbi:MAG: trimeric intracellular cation channel family protein [Ilumatobacteraceae bacterium]
MDFLPDLASDTPLWLALVTVGVNAIVGALQASVDDEHHWDIVGLSTFGLLMGLGGGFIRDVLIGHLPAESLRTPWYLVTVIGAIAAVLVLGQRIARITFLVSTLNALALGLFAVVGASAALRAGLPIISAVFVGTASAVGGGVLVSVMKDEVPMILVASAPNALVALLSAIVYSGTEAWDSRAAALAGVVAALLAHWATVSLGLRTKRAVGSDAVRLFRTRKERSHG